MTTHRSRLLYASLLASVLACSFIFVGSGSSIKVEFGSAPLVGFEPLANAIATSSISDGNYILEVRSSIAWGRLHLEDVEEFQAATRVQLLAGGPAQAAGILFDYKEAGTFSVFLVTGDGSCGLWDFDGTAYRSVSGWQKDRAILPAGEWNTLAVTASDGTARCSVNGREVLAVPHPGGTGGDVGLAAEAWGNGRASFDYLRLCDLGEAHPYRISIVSMHLGANTGIGEDFSHYMSIDGGPESLIAGDGMALMSGQFSGVRVVPVKIRTAGGVDTNTSAGYGSVQLVLYSCEPQSQEQTVRVRVCGDPTAGSDCGNAWADWEYVLRVVVD